MSRFASLALAAGLLAVPFAAGAAQADVRDTVRARARIHADGPRRGMHAMRMAPIQRVLAQRERLKLTDEQVTRLTALQTRYADLNKPHLETLKAARSDTAGRAQPARPAGRTPMTPEQRLEMRQQMLDRQKAFLAAHPEVSRAHAAIAENSRKAHDEVQSVLTDEQKALLKERMERRERMRPGTPGPAQRRPTRG